MFRSTCLYRLIFAGLLCGTVALQADPVTLVVHSADPLVDVGGWGGGRFRATLDGTPVYVFCVDFSHNFRFGVAYSVDVTPLNGDLAAQTRYGAVPDDGWNYGNSTYNATQRYMMAAWLTTQYLPYLADWSNASNRRQARGIQSAIWTLLDPAGSPHAPSGGNRNDWLQAAVTKIGQPDYDEPTDPFYRYFRVISPSDPRALRPQEFIVVVTPEPASVLMLGGVLMLLATGLLLRRRTSSRRANA
jgi:hypothetical protein